MIKKIISLLMVVFFGLSLSACSDNNAFSRDQIIDYAISNISTTFAASHTAIRNDAEEITHFEVRNTFLLPTSLPHANVTWVSSNEGAILIENPRAIVRRDARTSTADMSFQTVTLTATIKPFTSNVSEDVTFTMHVIDLIYDLNNLEQLKTLHENPQAGSSILVLGRIIAFGEFINQSNNGRYFVIEDGTSNAIVSAVNNNAADRMWMHNNLQIGNYVIVSGEVFFPGSLGGIFGNTAGGAVTIQVSNLTSEPNIMVLTQEDAENIIEEQELEEIQTLAPIVIDFNEPAAAETTLNNIFNNIPTYIGRQIRVIDVEGFSQERPGGQLHEHFTNIIHANAGGTERLQTHSTNARLQNNGTTSFDAFLVGRFATRLTLSILSNVEFTPNDPLPEPEGFTQIGDIISGEATGRVTFVGKVTVIPDALVHGTTDSLRNAARFVVVADATGSIVVRSSVNNAHSSTLWLRDNVNVGDLLVIDGIIEQAINGLVGGVGIISVGVENLDAEGQEAIIAFDENHKDWDEDLAKEITPQTDEIEIDLRDAEAALAMIEQVELNPDKFVGKTFKFIGGVRFANVHSPIQNSINPFHTFSREGKLNLRLGITLVNVTTTIDADFEFSAIFFGVTTGSNLDLRFSNVTNLTELATSK